MNKFTLITFYFFLIGQQLFCQTDTFQVNNISFVINSLQGWIPDEPQDSFQNASVWNYRSELVQQNSDIQSKTFIGIQITKKHPSDPPKDESKHREKWSLSQREIGGWKSAYKEFQPIRNKTCRTCPALTKRVYTFTLNRQEELNIMLFAYLNEPELSETIKTFDSFSNQFVKDNFNSMVDFGPINLSLQMNTDTFRVEKYFLQAPLPFDYRIVKNDMNGIYGYTIIDPAEDFMITVAAEYFDSKSRLGILMDTTIREHRDINGTTGIDGVSGHGTVKLSGAILQTKRIIELPDGGCIIVTFSSEPGYYNSESTSHTLTIYADMFVKENFLPKLLFNPIKFDAPSIDPKPKNDIRQPVKFEKTMPAAKPK